MRSMPDETRPDQGLLVRLCGVLALVLASALAPVSAQGATSRAELVTLPANAPLTPERLRGWQPLVAAFGAQAFSSWDQGLYAAALGREDEAARWWRQAALQGDTPPADAMCLAYRIARIDGPEVDSGPAVLLQSQAIRLKLVTWARQAVDKQRQRQPLDAQEAAALAAQASLPEPDLASPEAQRRLVLCRHVSSFPPFAKLFRLALTAGHALPPDALNQLGVETESAAELPQAQAFYDQAAAGFAPARLNQLRLRERIGLSSAKGVDPSVLQAGYRRLAQAGDGSAMIYLADLIERGHGDEQEAIALYRRGIDAGVPPVADPDQGFGYLMLTLYAQERLTAWVRSGRLQLTRPDERKRYLSVDFLLEEAFTAHP